MVLFSAPSRSNYQSGYLKATHLLNTGLSKTSMLRVSCQTLVLCPFTAYLTTMTRAKIQQAIGPHEDLLAIVKTRKVQWYGHVSRSLGLAKTILQGTVKGGRRQGRQRKRWEDNIREWTGLEFGKSQRAVVNKNIVYVSYVAELLIS